MGSLAASVLGMDGRGGAEAEAAPVQNQMRQRLEIESDKGLKLLYGDLKAEQAMAAKEMQKLEAKTDSIMQEVYQFLSLHAVFVGVVLGAVAQSSRMRCDAQWIPLALCSMVLLGSMAGISMKFGLRSRVLRRRRRLQALEVANTRELCKLSSQGTSYDLHSRVILINYSEPLEQSSWRWYSDLPFLFFAALLVAITLLVLASCHYILCHSPPSSNSLDSLLTTVISCNCTCNSSSSST